MREELEPCPFCGSDKIDVETVHVDHLTLFSVACVDCEAERASDESEAEAITAWNTRAPNEALTERADMAAEIERLRADVARLREPHWFYLGDDCSSDQCRFGIDECISEDFEWDNQPKGNHVLQISGARPVPDMWVALHYFTEEEMDQRGDDEPYTYTVHTTEEEARAALEARP